MSKLARSTALAVIMAFGLLAFPAATVSAQDDIVFEAEDLARVLHAGSSDIVEAEVVRFGQRRWWGRRAGVLRILRVYKGGLRVGQRLSFLFDDSLPVHGPMIAPRPPRRGSRGMLFLSAELPREPVRFRGFEPRDLFDEMVRLGLVSAAPR